jgi:hypothetical protein
MSEKNESKPPFMYFAITAIAVALIAVLFITMDYEFINAVENNPAHKTR